MPVERILFEILFCLLLPLLVGMAIHRFHPERSKPIGRICVRGATALLMFVVVAAFQSGQLDLSAYGWRIHAAIILLDVLQIAACMLLSWPFRVTSLDSFTGQIEVVVRNVHLGLLLKAALFPAAAASTDEIGAGVIFVLLYYGGASIVTGVIMTVVRRIELRVMGERHRALPPPELRGW
jgi:BASS family bile acid:Na+ symporter